MSFMVSPLNFCRVDRSRFFIGAISDQAFEGFQPSLNPQEAGLQNSFSAAVQSWVKRIFWCSIRIVGNINCGARNRGLRYYLDI